MTTTNNEECKEWIQEYEGQPTQFDSHEWVEIESNARIQVLRCKKCHKASSAILTNLDTLNHEE